MVLGNTRLNLELFFGVSLFPVPLEPEDTETSLEPWVSLYPTELFQNLISQALSWCLEM